ncbi:MAG: TonB-dependent receptor [Gammaproteobacteria bacterium]|nr:TonB-dependent receptor [Gammaproteobacteria bacterium]
MQIISAKSLRQSGFTTINEVLHNLSSNGQGTLGQSFSFAFAAGASGVSLRGLTLGDTLTLIDGERTVPYPLLDDNQRDFVDTSVIPFLAVKRVDVLENGGSGLYGGDAIAGVVNIILRKQYQGFKVTFDTGQTEQRDGTMERFSFIGGEGNLATDGYNWYVSGDFRHQDQILARNRSGLWDQLNFLQFGGFNLTPGASAAENPIVFPPATDTGILINPNNPSQMTYLPGCSPSAQAADLCLVPNPRAQLQPPTTRVDLLGRFTKSLMDGWTASVQASYFDSVSEEVGGQGGDFAATNTGYPTGLFGFAMGPGAPVSVVPNPPLVITVPATYPGNPYGAAAPLVYDFPELGPAVLKTDTSTERLLATLRGNIAGWHLKARAGAMYSRMIMTQLGHIETQALQSALNNGYILGSPDGASLFAPPMETTPTSQLDVADVTGTHTVLRLWGGPLKAAVGVQWFRETHNEHAPPSCAAGLQPCDPVYVIGTEKDIAEYAQVDAPIIKQFELTGNVRYDHYQQFGGSTSGGVAGLFKPLVGTHWNWVTLRASWNRAFRPPSAAEGIQSGETFGAGAYQDPALCPTATPSGMAAGPGDFPTQCQLFLTGIQTANPRLRNVHSTNWSAGLVLTPIRQASLSVDYYNIRVENDIISQFEAGGLGDFTSLIRGPLVSLPFCPSSDTAGCTAAQLQTTQTPVGPILAATYPYINAGETHTSGFDVGLKAYYNLGRFGRVNLAAHWTHLLTYQETVINPLTGSPTTYELAGTHGPSGISGDTGNPKDRATASLGWSKGPLDLTGSVYYTGEFSITDPSSGIPTCASAIGFLARFPGLTAQTPSSFCFVHHFIDTNFYGSYQLTGHFQVHAAVQNAFNRQPPLDVQTYGSGSLFYPYDAAYAEAGAIGRFWTVGATYEF